MKLAVVGSREFTSEKYVKAWVAKHYGHYSHLITGGARGVDTWAAEAWEEATGTKDNLIVIPADWDRYGKAAGFIRNVRIVKLADFVTVFWSKLSSGSLDDIGLAIGMEKPMNIYIR